MEEMNGSKKEQPLLVSTSLVAEIFSGRKTATRRLTEIDAKPGDLFWVRESWGLKQINGDWYNGSIKGLDATGVASMGLELHHRSGHAKEHLEGPWRPSVHMPRWACRILLEIVSVGCEKLQDITHAEALAEGVDGVDDFAALWDHLVIENAKTKKAPKIRVASFDVKPLPLWKTNPEVFVYRFRRCQ